jgi:16S rRNA (uracil1498-N3)-methyltransferase
VPEAALDLGPERSHYLRHVLRLPVGASLAVFNGRDGEWQATISAYARDRCRLAVARLRRAPPPMAGADLWLLFAPIKRTRAELLVEKATELGVARLLPVVTQHTDVVRLNRERLAAIAGEAAEQCDRLTVPEICSPEPLAAVLYGWPAVGRPLLVCAEIGPVRPIAAAMAALAPGPAAILVGPEGGFSAAELDELARHPFVVTVGLGPRVLRAETAAVAALACWQALCGDWSVGGSVDIRPPFRAGDPCP